MAGATGVTAVDSDAGSGKGGTEASGAGDGSPRARARRSVVLLVVLAVSVVLVDLVSKLLAVAHLSDRAPVDLVPNVLDIRLTRNSGAAFSLAGGATVVLSLVAFVVVVVIVRVARKLRSRWWAVVLGLLAGGAVGNLIDRVFRDPSPLRGHVVDWIHISHWPVFNVADAAITVGAVLAVALSFRGIGVDGTRIGAKVDADADDRPAAAADSESGGAQAADSEPGGAEPGSAEPGSAEPGAGQSPPAGPGTRP